MVNSSSFKRQIPQWINQWENKKSSTEKTSRTNNDGDNILMLIYIYKYINIYIKWRYTLPNVLTLGKQKNGFHGC